MPADDVDGTHPITATASDTLERVVWPDIIMASLSRLPASTKLVTAVRQVVKTPGGLALRFAAPAELSSGGMIALAALGGAWALLLAGLFTRFGHRGSP